MPAVTDRPPPGDLAAVKLMLADPTLLIEEVMAACGIPAHLCGEPAPATCAERVVAMPCPGRPGGVRVVCVEGVQ
ncbi:MAG TPA: hypothetical protein VD866_29965 [Urbifossiella sp.]|nr:hypothetical protein [Urbifossiella sp.]